VTVMIHPGIWVWGSPKQGSTPAKI
jgi:hypothetical protein